MVRYGIEKNNCLTIDMRIEIVIETKYGLKFRYNRITVIQNKNSS